MSDLKRYQGVFPAFYACYDERGNVSPERAARLTEHLISKGVQGLYVCGSSGECIYQDVEERKETLRAVVEAAAGRVTIIAHVAANSTRDKHPAGGACAEPGRGRHRRHPAHLFQAA